MNPICRLIIYKNGIGAIKYFYGKLVWVVNNHLMMIETSQTFTNYERCESMTASDLLFIINNTGNSL